MPGKRAATVLAFSRFVAEGGLEFAPHQPLEEVSASLKLFRVLVSGLRNTLLCVAYVIRTLSQQVIWVCKGRERRP